MKERSMSGVRGDRSGSKARGESVVRGRGRVGDVGASTVGSSYSPSRNANGAGRSMSSGPRSVSRGASVSRDNVRQPSVTRGARQASVTRDRGRDRDRGEQTPERPGLTRNPSLTRSLIPRYTTSPQTNVNDTPIKTGNLGATLATRPPLRTSGSMGSTWTASSSPSSINGIPPLSPGSETPGTGRSRDSSQDRVGRGIGFDRGARGRDTSVGRTGRSPSVGRSPSLGRLGRNPAVDRFGRAPSEGRPTLTVDGLGQSPPERSPSTGPRTPEEYGARSRSRGRFTAGLEIVDEGEGAWGVGVHVKEFEVKERDVKM